MTKTQFEHDVFLSPFTWRYGSEEMRATWSDVHRRRLWRRVWVALAQAAAVTAWSGIANQTTSLYHVSPWCGRGDGKGVSPGGAFHETLERMTTDGSSGGAGPMMGLRSPRRVRIVAGASLEILPERYPLDLFGGHLGLVFQPTDPCRNRLCQVYLLGHVVARFGETMCLGSRKPLLEIVEIAV